jgi:hypothetical protein
MKNETTARKASKSEAYMPIQKTGTIDMAIKSLTDTFVSLPIVKEMAVPALMVFKK